MALSIREARVLDGIGRQVRVGIDVGGTFTDFVFLLANGVVAVRKHPTTPLDPSAAVLAGLKAARAEGLIHAGYVLSHGATVATNALLERRGAATALITTRGFRDVLEIGRQARRHLYALDADRPAPLVARERRFEIGGRIDWRGEEIEPLDEAALRRIVREAAAAGIESVAVCLLFSHLNAAHERRAGEEIEAAGMAASLSSSVAPEPREYERSATVTANAFVAPIMSRYLARLGAAVSGEGASRLRIMQSNGGTLSPREAGDHAIKTTLSGPAGGVIAAARIAADAGFDRLLTFDMGGTSTDVAVVVDGGCDVATQPEVAGMPLRTPMLDIHTVGAGGGSVAWLDAAGALRVGPRSAGAAPGPVAYGVGDELTVTDANLLLGRLPADLRLAGTVRLDDERVRRRFDTFAARLGRTAEELAAGILEIAQASMARALRHISVERGHDPAGFALLSFGGAGGLQACALAAALGIHRVIVPRYPGALSALGLAIAPVRHEIARAFRATVISAGSGEGDWRPVRAALDSLDAAAADRRRSEAAEERLEFRAQRFLDMRYSGQSFEIRVPLDGDDIAAAAAEFHRLHRMRYGHADPSEPVETSMARCVLIGVADTPPLRFARDAGSAGGRRATRVFESDTWLDAEQFDRAALDEGARVRGPAILTQTDAATYLPSDWQCVVDGRHNLILAPR
ncbi:MAG TPA: hydantoinase/oxoprolinase family protein [Chthonomonadaceae bacterium]|nr:hydantoinase/oxoprolinase family protein [Chthonomonadaceae bacterium]